MTPNFNLGSKETSQSILRSGYLTVGDALRYNARIIPDRVAIEWDKGALTFAQLNTRANSLANAFLAQGIARGDRVAVLAENRVEYCEVVYAAAKLGIIVPCLNWRLSPDELTYCINLTSPETIVVSAIHRNLFEQVRNELPSLRRIFLSDSS